MAIFRVMIRIDVRWALIPPLLSCLGFSNLRGQDSGVVTLEDELRTSSRGTEQSESIPPTLPTEARVATEEADSIPQEAFQEPPSAAAEELIEEQDESTEIGPADDSAYAEADSPREIRAAADDLDIVAAEAFSDSDRLGLADILTPIAEFFDLGAPAGPDARDDFRLSLGATVGYDDNVLQSADDPTGSGTSGLDASFLYNFGTERLDIRTELSAGITYYDSRPEDDNDLNADFLLAVTYAPNRRSFLAINSQTQFLSQPNPVLVGAVTRFSGDYYYTDNSLIYSYNVTPILIARLRYQFSGFRYVEESINQNQGFYQQVFALGLEYRVSPRTGLSLEYRFNPILYYEADLGSTGQIVTVGFNHLFTPQIRWDLQFGAEQREVTDPGPTGPDSYTGPFFETNLSYQFSPRSFVNGSIRFGTEPSGAGALSINQTLRGTLSGNYAFTGRLTGTLGITYQAQEIDGPGEFGDTSQTIYSAFLGFRFLLNPSLALTANYNYLAVETEFALSSYTRGRTSLGLEIIF